MATHSNFLPRESRRQRSLVGCCPEGRTEPDMTKVTQQQQPFKYHPIFSFYPPFSFSLSFLFFLSLSLPRPFSYLSFSCSPSFLFFFALGCILATAISIKKDGKGHQCCQGYQYFLLSPEEVNLCIHHKEIRCLGTFLLCLSPQDNLFLIQRQ